MIIRAITVIAISKSNNNMRHLLFVLFFFALFSASLEAQRGRGPILEGVWLETSIDRRGRPLPVEFQPKRTTLILDADGYFEEVRPGRTRYSAERRYLGRWDADYRYGLLTLRVDQPDRRVTARPPTYRNNRLARGRTQNIPFSIVFSDRDELVLRDRRDGRKRFFVRE